jgi:hypothetical protein
MYANHKTNTMMMNVPAYDGGQLFFFNASGITSFLVIGLLKQRPINSFI